MSRTKPIERFPLTPRADGRFQKRINGHLFYFGRDGDRDAAIREYDRVKYDLYAGKRPRSVAEPGTVTLKAICNLFLDEQIAREKAGDISRGHLRDYEHALRRFLRRMTPARIIDDLRPDDFSDYGRFLRGKCKLGVYAYNRERACIVAMFNHAADCGWIDRPVRVGRGFQKASTAELREVRKRRLVSREGIQALLKHADATMQAAILLGVNGGLGATDCAILARADIDLNKGQLLAIRRKRKTLRAVPLWPETVEKLKAVSSAGELVFGIDGCVAESARISWIIKQFSALCDVAKIPKPHGVAFGALRHTFATIANGVPDHDAVRRIMGHRLPGLSDVYVEDIDWERLKKVTDHVRRAIGYPQNDPRPTES